MGITLSKGWKDNNHALHIYPTPKTKTAVTLRNRSYSRLSYGIREATPTKRTTPVITVGNRILQV